MLLKHWQTEGDSVSGVNEGLAKKKTSRKGGSYRKGRKRPGQVCWACVCVRRMVAGVAEGGNVFRT